MDVPNLVGRTISKHQVIDVTEEPVYDGYNDYVMLSFKWMTDLYFNV
jgi:hypothetical protein